MFLRFDRFSIEVVRRERPGATGPNHLSSLLLAKVSTGSYTKQGFDYEPRPDEEAMDCHHRLQPY